MHRDLKVKNNYFYIKSVSASPLSTVIIPFSKTKQWNPFTHPYGKSELICIKSKFCPSEIIIKSLMHSVSLSVDIFKMWILRNLECVVFDVPDGWGRGYTL